MTLINQLAQAVGFHDSYVNCFGATITAEDESRAALLTAMGYDLSSDSAIFRQIEQIQNSRWLELIQPTNVIKSELTEHACEIVLLDNEQSVVWQLELEDGSQLNGEFSFTPSATLESRIIEQVNYRACRLPLPKLEQGYHQLRLTTSHRQAESFLIVAPPTCYQPQQANAAKIWGFAAQVYSLKSSSSIGMGDFSDLNKFVVEAAKNDASLVGINPVHPLFPNNPAHRSPYSPSSRCFWNVMYLDVHEIAERLSCSAAQALLNSNEFKQQLQSLNEREQIDYSKAGELKFQVLELLYQSFCSEHRACNSELEQAFVSFCHEQGQDLETLTTYDALYEYFRERDEQAYGWRYWPEEYQSPTTEAVAQFQSEHRERIDFYAFLQWNCDWQLNQIASDARRAGMPVGLYLDLAVGSDGGGADVWANRSVYVAGGSVGAPPDATNSLGQDWGLTPINPLQLERQGYQALIKPLRSCMRHAGALRIDHVLGYMRQYWVAPGKRANEGIYIRFPFEDMLRVIALESQRSQCVVIGEDLGTMPEGFSEIMARAGLLSYRILFFERWDSGLFHRPEVYPEQAMVTVSTHDLPTVNGWWSENDLHWREQLNLYPEPQMACAERNHRIADREKLLAALQDAECINVDSLTPQIQSENNLALVTGVQKYLAKSPGFIQMIPLEDALGLTEQVNIPGTIDEHPNWLQRLPVSIKNLWQDKTLQAVVAAMNHLRPRGVATTTSDQNNKRAS